LKTQRFTTPRRGRLWGIPPTRVWGADPPPGLPLGEAPVVGQGLRTTGASPKARPEGGSASQTLSSSLYGSGGSSRDRAVLGAKSGLWCLVETAIGGDPSLAKIRLPERTAAVEGGRRAGAADVLLWPSFGRGARSSQPQHYHERLAHREARGGHPQPRPGRRDSPEAPGGIPQRPPRSYSLERVPFSICQSVSTSRVSQTWGRFELAKSCPPVAATRLAKTDQTAATEGGASSASASSRR